jgi:hypothetical protein
MVHGPNDKAQRITGRRPCFPLKRIVLREVD